MMKLLQLTVVFALVGAVFSSDLVSPVDMTFSQCT